MPLEIAIQMDHVSHREHRRATPPSPFARSAAARPQALPLYTGPPVAARRESVLARVEEMAVRTRRATISPSDEPVRTDLSEMDVILLRQDPPFDMNYITTTHMLERIHPPTLVVNDPAWVRNSPEKIFVTEFADLMPETLITKDPLEVAAFRREYGDIIVKPLYGNGGAGIFHLRDDDRNLSALLEMFAADVPRTLHRPALSEGRAQGRQADHPHRRRGGRRDQPRAG